MELIFSSFVFKSKIILFLILIFLGKVYSTNNEITIFINASISSGIINTEYINYNESISEVDVNGKKSNINDYYNLLNKGIYEITIKFNESLSTCFTMFYKLNNIVIIDILNFDSSNVKNMDWIFENCSSLVSLNLRSFNTSTEISMNYMFHNCIS